MNTSHPRFRWRKVATVVVVGLSACLLGKAGQAQEKGKLSLAEAGQPKAVIVIPDFAGRQSDDQGPRMELQAGKILADFLHRMTGAEFKIVYAADLGDVQVQGDHISSANVPSETYILVGDSTITRRFKLPAAASEPGATFVRAQGNTLMLEGAPDGTAYMGGAVYSAYELLEKLGCRYLWPGKTGLVVPKQNTVSVAYGTQQLVPLIKQRYMRMSFGYDRAIKGAELLGISRDEYKKTYDDAGTVDASFVERGYGGWEQWQKLGGDIQIAGGHTFGALWDAEGKAHPGWFALQPDGTRTQHSSERARLCVSNSELINHIADGIIERVKKDPTLRSVSLSPNDGGPDTFCMCKVNALGEPGCMTLDPPNGRIIKNFRGWNRDYVSLTDRYVYFWNKIAERVKKVKPDLLFVVDAYSYYDAPPVERKLDPNMVVRYIQYSLRDWDEWSSKASMMTMRPTALHTPWQVGYLQFNNQWAKDLQYVAHHNCVETDYDSMISNWATEGLNYYVLARLNYNPDLKVDEIIEDFCRTGFGAGHASIRQYYDKAAKLTDDQQALEAANFAAPEKNIVSPRLDAFAKVYGPAEITQLRGYLDAAKKAVAGDDAASARIDFLRVGLDWTEMQGRAYRMLIAWKQHQPVDLVAAGKLLEERRTMERDIFRNNTLAVNISYANFGDRGFWDALEGEIAKNAKGQAAKAPAAGKTIDADENGQPIVVPTF